jgi:peptidyl-prolyl cis-trans isomerase SurA
LQALLKPLSKMKKIVTSLILLLTISFSASVLVAQTGSDEVLFTVDGNPVTKGEFLYVYQKNNPTKKNDMSRESLQEYLDLYINFKLKVAEAHALRIDTTRKVREELDKYGDQLIKSNFDKEVLEPAIRKHYDRMKTERLVFHVMQALAANSTAEDSAKAIAQITEAWEAVQKGEDFERVAVNYSTDPNAEKTGGRVGWVTGFSIPDMHFEDMTFETPVGKVSPVFQTKYGYHFLTVKEERPSSGKVKVQHILIKVPQAANPEMEAKAKMRADSIYTLLRSGERSFDELVSLSDDQTTAQRGGQLDWFGVGKMVAPFESAAFALQNPGDISEPVRTSYGWHIIRLQEKQGLGTFEEVSPDIKNRIERSSQYTDLRNDYVNKVRNRYAFNEYPENKMAVIATLDSSFINNSWNADMAKGMDKPVFTIGDKTFDQDDFAITLQVKQRAFRDKNIDNKANKIYQQAYENMLIEYDMSERNVDFSRLMQEYRDGIPLFALLEEKVWTAAAKDTAGLEAFYEANKTDYMWEERVAATIYNCADAATAKSVRKLVKKNTADSLILAKINTDSVQNVTIQSGKFLPGQNTNVDNMNKKPGTSDDILNASGNITFVKLHNIVPAQPKTLAEARGYVISDYQDQLEKNWIASLRKKYPVKVNESVFNSMVE